MTGILAGARKEEKDAAAKRVETAEPGKLTMPTSRSTVLPANAGEEHMKPQRAGRNQECARRRLAIGGTIAVFAQRGGT